MSIYRKVIKDKKANKKSFALLIDPDKQGEKEILALIEKAKDANECSEGFKVDL